ncbi:MAG: asparagine--tRNA ligase [Candidatus Micrarchaeota archaeon]
MIDTKISDIFLKKMEGEKVTFRGWIYRHRVGGGGAMVFAVVRDASGVIQVTLKKENIDEKSFKQAADVYLESSITVSGTVKKDDRAPGGYEIVGESFETISKGEPFPISKDLSEEFLLDVRHLWLRSQKLTNVMKARAHIVNYLREFFAKDGFWEVPPPIITKADCEGGSEVFKFNYFGEEASLTQSSQMYAEVFIYSLEKVYVLAPSFRAEKSRTLRHLAEYWHLEPEMAFYDYKMNMELQEQMVEYVAQNLVKNHPDLLKALGRNPDDLAKVKGPFERMDYENAVEKVNELGGKMEYGQDFGHDEEVLITKDLEKPIFVHHFPKEIKSFYMKEDPTRPGTVLNNDLLAPNGHGEIIGGSERIWQIDELLARMEEKKMPKEGFKWYTDLRRYGSVPHSGFGLGIERLTKWMLNLDHIRDTIPFPRTITRCYP